MSDKVGRGGGRGGSNQSRALGHATIARSILSIYVCPFDVLKKCPFPFLSRRERAYIFLRLLRVGETMRYEMCMDEWAVEGWGVL